MSGHFSKIVKKSSEGGNKADPSKSNNKLNVINTKDKESKSILSNKTSVHIVGPGDGFNSNTLGVAMNTKSKVSTIRRSAAMSARNSQAAGLFNMRDVNDDGVSIELLKWMQSSGGDSELTHVIEPIDIEPDCQIDPENISYSVCCVIVNDQGDILLVHEKANSNNWYIPEGEVEKRETFVQAIKRIVSEQSGLRFEPETILSVETKKMSSWLRFNFAGIVSGKIITDKYNDGLEFTRAKYADLNEIHQDLSFQSTDIFPIIEIGHRFALNRLKNSKQDKALNILTIPKFTLPILNGHKHIFIRAAFLKKEGSTDLANYKYLMCYKSLRQNGSIQENLPVSEYYKTDHSFHYPLLRILLAAFGVAYEPKILGIICVEHNANAHPKEVNDGSCLTVLAEPSIKVINMAIKQPFYWEKIYGDVLHREIKDRTRIFGSVVLYSHII